MHHDRTSGDATLSLGDLLNCTETAELLSELLHQPVKIRTLSTWPIPYRRVGHYRLWDREDVVAFARQRLANAPRNIGKPPKFAVRISPTASTETIRGKTRLTSTKRPATRKGVNAAPQINGGHGTALNRERVTP
jgi:hypothetical protein